MAINDWWASDPAELYWMETTNRPDLGVDLNAPQLNGAGKPEWGYTLVSETRPGDIVFHWHKDLTGHPAIVGWSRITGPLYVDADYSWMPQGTRGRARGVPTVGPGWRMPCESFTPLATPIDGNVLANREDELRAVQEEVASRAGGALYFPFNFYRRGEVRSSQSYLTKFPAALLKVLPELSVAATNFEAPEDGASGSEADNDATSGGRLQDPRLRAAIERHALDAATAHYIHLGATDVIERGKPFDLVVLGLGPQLHVEVKGSSTTLSGIELTVNEVAHASNHQPTDLFVVDQIHAERLTDGSFTTTGGRKRVWTGWAPAQANLSATRYTYRLPDNVG